MATTALAAAGGTEHGPGKGPELLPRGQCDMRCGDQFKYGDNEGHEPSIVS